MIRVWSKDNVLTLSNLCLKTCLNQISFFCYNSGATNYWRSQFKCLTLFLFYDSHFYQAYMSKTRLTFLTFGKGHLIQQQFYVRNKSSLNSVMSFKLFYSQTIFITEISHNASSRQKTSFFRVILRKSENDFL